MWSEKEAWRYEKGALRAMVSERDKRIDLMGQDVIALNKHIESLEAALKQISDYEVRPATAAYELKQIASRILEGNT